MIRTRCLGRARDAPGIFRAQKPSCQKKAFVAKRSGIKIRSLASMSSQHIEVYLAGRTALATRNAGYMDHMHAAVHRLGDWPAGPGRSRGNTKTMYEASATDIKRATP